MKTLRLSLAAAFAAALVAACGGGDAPVEPAGGSQAAAARERAQQLLGRHRVPIRNAAAYSRIDRRLRTASGPVDVWITLDQTSVAAERALQAESAGIGAARGAQSVKAHPLLRQNLQGHRQRIRQTQQSMADRLAAFGARELARVQVSHNAIAVRVDASRLGSIAALDGVAQVRPVLHYKLDLRETVPYIGASPAQTGGRDGSGVRVAVLDSGVDYTHRNLGGPGTTAAYQAAYGAAPSDARNTTRDGLFPTGKVYEGFDFVGETWGIVDGSEVGTRTEDPDPIDFGGHGTHVADIIAGRSRDGTHTGVAPGAKVLAVKVCSAISSACNGIALLKAMDYALDPDGDSDTDDAVDVINMSLGSDYGQVEDDLSAASANAVRLGVVVVTSAGNGANKPYIVGSPSTADGVISVAQTQVPSALGIPLVVNAPAAIASVYPNTETLDFAPVGSGVTGDVVFVGRGCPAGSIDGSNPADPYAQSPAGRIALIDRGSCAVSLKIDRAAKAGATGVLIGLVAPGDAISFSFGGGDQFVPSLVIQQVLSGAIKARLQAGDTVNATMSPTAGIALVGGMAGSSSRGPSIQTQRIKPELGAPGASMSAEVGTGTGETAFSGTSGAAPMVAGAAALLVQAYPHRSPAQIKSMLMNSAETVVYTNPAVLPGELAPITRIGAGEVRVDRAIALKAIAWNRESKSAALSFGAHDVSEPKVLKQTLRIENFAGVDRSYTLTPTFRFATDEATGAVRVLAPSHVHVQAGGHEDVDVRLVIDPGRLPEWLLDGGSRGADGPALNGPEYDGYLTLTSGSERLSVPWHVLPRKSARTRGWQVDEGPVDALLLFNRGVESGGYDAFSLTGTSRRARPEDLPGPGDNFAFIDLQAVGVRYLPASLVGLDLIEFAIHTHGRRSHPNYPAEFDVVIDANNDGAPDYVVFNADIGFGSVGQNAVWVVDLATGVASPVFYTDADLNSSNVILTVPMAAVGARAGATFGFSILAFDNYYTGWLTDAIENMRFTPGRARFGVDGAPFGSVAPGSAELLKLRESGVPGSASTEKGLLMLYRRNAGSEAQLFRDD